MRKSELSVEHVLLTVLLLASAPAAAELVELDFEAAGDALITWDTETDYEWLDLTATTNTSLNEIDGDVGGWLSAGFRRATGDEICELFRHMGFASEPCPAPYPGLQTPLRFPASGEEVARHLDLLGVTWFYPSGNVDQVYAIGWFDDGNVSTILTGQATVERQIYSNVPIDRARADVWTGVYSPVYDGNFKISKIGHFLVRAGPTACNDGEDNDGDGLLDAGQDPGCDNAFDNSETSSEFACDDGVDNDGDGLVDAAADPGCSRPDEPFEDSEDPESQHVLILHAGASAPVEALLATGRFSSITAVRTDYANAPEPRVVFDYDAILAYTSSYPRDAELLGDLLADYADTGGRVVLATYALSPPWNIAGRITEPGYSPLVSIGDNGEVSGALVPTKPGDWVFEGVDLEAVSFHHNSNYAHPELDSGATLLATDGEGHLMLARSESGNVIALNAVPSPFSSNSAAFYDLLANTLLPAPDVLKVRIEVTPFRPESQIVMGSQLPFAVALLGSEELDVTTVDPESLAFGPGEAAPVWVVGRPGGKSGHGDRGRWALDLDGDEHRDLLLLFQPQDTGLVLEDTEACLTGMIGEQRFEGCAAVQVVLHACGLGAELVLVLASILALRRWLAARASGRHSVDT